MSLLLRLLIACCRNADAPQIVDPGVVHIDPGEILEIPLADLVASPIEKTEVASTDGDVLAAVDGEVVRIVAGSAFRGGEVELEFTDACGTAVLALVLRVNDETTGECETRVEYRAQGAPDAVYLAGTFNDWSATATPMTEVESGVWSVDLALDPGSYPYKVVESSFSGEAQWSCNPDADFVQCDEGYSWNPGCPLGQPSCNSMLVVKDCDKPEVKLLSLDIDRLANTVRVEMDFPEGVAVSASLDDELIAASESMFLDDLEDGRHTLRILPDGGEELYIPVWLDDRDWAGGLMYYVFVDRFANGDSSNDFLEGTGVASTDYAGGDYQGVLDRMDWLEELGVTVIWITAPQDNPAGTWGQKCGVTFSGYHGYWPADPFAVEDHFGDEALLRELVDEAHARGIRVLVDWVANHVHTDHPYYKEHPEWFNDELICEGDVWNTDPEVCWFDSFLPDIRYYDPEPLTVMVDDAVQLVKMYELDGYRVDAVKHMPHSVFANFNARARLEIEHSDVGGDEDFYTVGETFSGDRGLIGSYVNEGELDAQFDFTLYWSILGAIGRNEGSLQDLEATFDASQAAYAGYVMSTFLGNHDVERWIAHASGEISSLYGDGTCDGSGNLRTPDSPPDQDQAYERLKLGWTFLLTHEGLPLVYYGDEIGLPGYADPDNRQVMRFEGLSAREQGVLDHVRALGQARQEHPSFSRGARVQWWSESDVLAWARVSGGDQVLAVINRSGSDRTLSNGLSFAGLTPGATYIDVLTGKEFTANGDSIQIDVPALGSRVLVPKP